MPQPALASRRVASAIALAVSCCALLAWSPAAGAARPLTTGVSYVYENDPASFENVRRTGSKLVLTPLRWGRIAPARRPAAWNPADPADPNYDWEEFDVWLLNAVNAGLTPIFQVRGAPLWAQRCPGEVDAPCRIEPAELAAFATAAARRYSGGFGGLPRVYYWQGLNEPNLSLFFLPQHEGGRVVSPEIYRELINVFYAAIKAVDPTNLVIAAGLGPVAVPGYTIGPMRFTRELLCMRGRKRPRPSRGNCGGGVRFDIFDIHPYTSGSPAHEGRADDVQLGDLRKLQALLHAADRAERIEGAFKRTPLWVTELSWDSKPPDPGGLPMRILTRWTAEALFTAWRAGVHNFLWYSLRDGEHIPNTPSYLTPESGLFFRGPTPAQDTPKAAMHAFRFPFVAYAHRHGKPALDFWGRTPNSEGGRVTIQARRGGGWRRIGVARADRVGIFRGRLRNGYGRRSKGAVRAVYHGQAAVPFSMRRVGDFRHPPFGRPVG